MAEADAAVAAPAPVQFRELATVSGQRIGVAQLNAEKSLNALTLPMIRLLDPQLQRWAADPGIACVVLHGAGEKAFCAGGDVRSLYKAITDHQGPPPNPDNLAFFSEEYRLDYRIHTYAKPLLVWGSGIVMGGGLGLMAGASHRVVTETSRVAMPEITIGLFPDVGGSYFLSRIADRVGLFLALTGVSINAHDLLHVKLADHFLRAADRDAVFERLAGCGDWSADAEHNHRLLTRLLDGLGEAARGCCPSRTCSGMPRRLRSWCPVARWLRYVRRSPLIRAMTPGCAARPRHWRPARQRRPRCAGNCSTEPRR